MSLSPQTALALRDSACITFPGLIVFGGSRSGGSETPVSVWLVIEHFSRAQMSIFAFCWQILIPAGNYIQSDPAV